MALTEIKYGDIASSKTLNDNFEYLDDKVSTAYSNINNVNASLVSLINTTNANIEDKMDAELESIREELNIIGQPICRLDDSIYENEIRLEGAAVSRVTYSELFKIYGTKYGEGDGSTTFNLPNFLNRTIQGSTNFGYIEAALPNITGATNAGGLSGDPSGAFYLGSGTTWYGHDGGWTRNVNNFNASRCSNIYKDDCQTVQPPAIKVRWVTRYK